MTNKVTVEIPVDGREALVKHIEELQGIITLRNARIAELEEQLDQYQNHPSQIFDAFRREGYIAGYSDCQERLKRDLEGLNNLASIDIKKWT